MFNAKTKERVWNMFKVKNENTTTTSFTWFWCFYCQLWTYSTPFSSVSIVDFEQVNASSELNEDTKTFFLFFKLKVWILLTALTGSLVSGHFWFFTRFFVSTTFRSNTRLKLAKNEAIAKQQPETDLYLVENYSLLTFTLSSKRQ